MIDYIIGILDSEGHVRIRRTQNKNYKAYFSCEVTISNTNKDIINFIVSKYPECVIQEHQRANRKKEYKAVFNHSVLKTSSFLKDALSRSNEKYFQLLCIKNIFDIEKDNEQIYSEYLTHKKSFLHPIQNTPTPEYLAGIIDGDGWITLFNSSKGKPSILNRTSVGLQQRYRPLVEYLALKLGSSVLKNKVDLSCHTQTFSTYGSNYQIKRFVEEIYPFLIEKKYKASLTIEYLNEEELFRKKSTEILNKFKGDSKSN